MNHTIASTLWPRGYLLEAPLRLARHPRTREIALGMLGLGFSLSILAAVMLRLGTLQVGALLAIAPRLPLFWLVFAASYLLGPFTEWIIYRRLWSVGPAAIVPLLRKQVANEIVLGYSGDAQFYLWARRHAGVEGSVFGNLRDVTILSALAGNLATLLMMVATAPWLFQLATGPIVHALVGSVGVIVVTSLAVFALRRRYSLFTMSRRDLAITFALHSMRIVLGLLLSATLWHLLLPGIPLGTLVVIATLRMMVTRLPLLTASDALLAGLILVLIGTYSGISAAISVMATLIIATHLAVGLLTTLGGFATRQPAKAE